MPEKYTKESRWVNAKRTELRIIDDVKLDSEDPSADMIIYRTETGKIMSARRNYMDQWFIPEPQELWATDCHYQARAGDDPPIFKIVHIFSDGDGLAVFDPELPNRRYMHVALWERPSFNIVEQQ